MKAKPQTTESRRPGLLTPAGWKFLISLLSLAGYNPVDEQGKFVVRESLQEDFFLALEPEAQPIASLKIADRERREQHYVKIRARLQRLRPGHPEETVTEATLKALSQLRGVRDPALLDRGDAYQLLRQITSASDPYKIDFLRFCRRLTVVDSMEVLPVPTQRVGYGEQSNSTADALKEHPKTGGPAVMYLGGVSFCISKSFGNLQLIPEVGGLRLLYLPIENGNESAELPGYLNLVLPLETVGALLATAIAFYDQKVSLDENVILQPDENSNEHPILIKLYRDKPRGPNGQMSGEETCWLRLVTGPTETERRRVLLTPRDLIAWIEACRLTAVLAASAGTHKPRPLSAFTIERTINPKLLEELRSQQEKHPNS